MGVDACDGGEVCVMCWAVYEVCGGVNVGVGADCCAESVEGEYVEEVVFV